MEILHFKEFDDAESVDTNECSLGVYLVIDNFWGIQSVVWLKTVVLGVSNFNSNSS